jgi:hypothetical protein
MGRSADNIQPSARRALRQEPWFLARCFDQLAAFGIRGLVLTRSGSAITSARTQPTGALRRYLAQPLPKPARLADLACQLRVSMPVRSALRVLQG